MNKRKRVRIIFLLVSITSITFGLVIILNNLSNNIMFFLTPTEIKNNAQINGKMVKIGGLVKPNTIKYIPNSTATEFTLTDCNSEIKINYQGILPSLFKEKQGIIAKGVLKNDNVFYSKELLTKHDENYMPPEINQTMNVLKNEKFCSNPRKF